MSEGKFSAKFEVKPSGIPARVTEEFENVKHPSAIKLLSVSRTGERAGGGNKSNGLTMLEMKEFANDPFWINVRRALLVLSALLFLLLFVVSIFIIVYTPGCGGGSLSEYTWRTRECKSDEECAAIQNTTCMSDPRDYKMRCLCRDSSAPINGACPNRPRAVGSPCKMDNECIEGSECKSMNITVTSFKTCQCKDGFTSRDGYCSSAIHISGPSLFTLLFGAVVVILMSNKTFKVM